MMIPTGMPANIAIVTEITIIAIVTMAGSQRFTNPMIIIPIEDAIAMRSVDQRHANRKTSDTVTGHGIQRRAFLSFPRVILTPSLIPSKNHSPLTTAHWILASIATVNSGLKLVGYL